MDNYLGKILRDKITGLEGVAILRSTQLNGNVRYVIELPPGADKNDTTKVHEVDGCRYEVVGEGPMAPVPVPDMAHVKLGSKVRDKFSGYTGHVSARCDNVTGCAQFLVVSETLDKEGRPVNEWFDGLRLETFSETDAPRMEQPQTRTGSSMRTGYKSPQR